MRAAPALALCAVLAGGCATETVVSEGPLTARSYARFEGTVEHGVGVLRRLVVPDARAVFLHDGDRKPAMEAADAATTHDTAVAYLRNWRGYDVIVPAPADEDLDLDDLRDWAAGVAPGVAPPESVLEIVSALGTRHAADGVLLLSSRRKPPSSWNVYLVVGTACLTWPLLLIEKEGVLEADLVEVASGRVVWRATKRAIDSKGGTFGDDFSALPASFVVELLAPIEPAVPEILTRK